MSTAYNNFTKKTNSTPQTQPVLGREADMAQNNAGGYSFKLNDWKVLDRFLILGTEGNTYYCSEQKMVVDNAKNIINLIKSDGVRVVKTIVEISDSGRAPKNDACLFALALVMTYGDNNAKSAAYEALTKVARIGTHLFHLAAYVNDMRGWGRGVRGAFGNWYNSKKPMNLAMQMVKYANRDGWTHKDILRLAHIKPVSPDHDALFTDAVGKAKEIHIDDELVQFMAAVEEIKTTTNVNRAIELITQYNLPREVLPTEILKHKEIWEALLPHMGLTALIRNIATMTRVGLIAPLSSGTKDIIARLYNSEELHKSRVHPIQVLSALNTYSSGHSARGSNSWTPTQQIVDALDDAFYAAFDNVAPTGKNQMLALDISGSMTWGTIAGIPGLTPRVASAAMAMVTARVEPSTLLTGFHNSLITLKISGKSRLADVINYIDRLGFGSTDCSLPAKWCKNNRVNLDAISIYTDNETFAGVPHPFQALTELRKSLGHDVKQIVVGMTATNFTIADPADSSSIDVVGFDSSAPALIADFIRDMI